jgi:hypothetical protein
VSANLDQIKAIKEYRNRTGCGLREAYDAVMARTPAPPSEVEALRASLAAAEAEVKVLTGERDEAVALGREFIDGFDSVPALVRALIGYAKNREKDRQAAEAERDEALGALTKARDMLANIQWEGRTTRASRAGIPYEVRGCPVCYGEAIPSPTGGLMGHTLNCALASLLGRAGGGAK